jgi:YggT family protein
MNIYELLATILRIYSFVLLARALVSWIPNLDHSHPAVQILYRVTEPVLEPIRRLVPPIGGVMDISMIIAFFALIVLEQLLLGFA